MQSELDLGGNRDLRSLDRKSLIVKRGIDFHVEAHSPVPVPDLDLAFVKHNRGGGYVSGYCNSGRMEQKIGERRELM